jgi:serine phosphatase RsbU (regulator of sigma subunit)
MRARVLDGIVEAANSSEEPRGEERPRALVQTATSPRPEDLADALVAAVADWTRTRPGQAAEDDLTVVGIDDEDPA